MTDEIIEITDRALFELNRAAEEEGLNSIRISCLGGGCAGISISMDFTKWPADPEFDLKFEKAGLSFIIDQKSAAFLSGATLDYNTKLLERGFKWDIPGSSSCGCGVSFSF